MIHRTLEQQIMKELQPGKAVILYGARQVGKTTISTMIMEKYDGKNKYINCDELIYQEALSQRSVQVLSDLIDSNSLLVIDEAQRVPNIGMSLKLIVDNFPNTALLVTGSASFELANQTSEALTGRKILFTLFPLSFYEMKEHNGIFEASANIENYLIYGGYPEVEQIKTFKEKQRYLDEIVGSYLYRDILELEGIKRANKIVDLLRLIVYQIGYEVSLTELGSKLGMNKITVEKYLDLLEKSFVIFRVSGFSRNLRKEITKMSRFYFYDNGVRNALIRNFNPLNKRQDIGQLWENYIAIERKKTLQRKELFRNMYFWRTYDQKEIDLIEEGDGKIYGFETKFNQKRISKATRNEFLSAYPEAELSVIHKDNFDRYVG